MIFELLEKIAEIIDAPFYSVDVIQRAGKQGQPPNKT
jgi:hypothetical protein